MLTEPIQLNPHTGGVRYNLRWRIVSVKTIYLLFAIFDLFLKFFPRITMNKIDKNFFYLTSDNTFQAKNFIST